MDAIEYAWRWLTMLSIVAEKEGHIAHEWWATDDEEWMLQVLRAYKHGWRMTVKRRGAVIATRGM
jgi:hypothetical protein